VDRPKLDADADMCLIAFCWQPDADTPLVLAANRDEFHARPTRPLSWWCWPEGPLAGRDLSGGGTWLAVGRDGRFAAVTNFRDPSAESGERSRGELPLAWMDGNAPAAVFAKRVHDHRHQYGPFSLLFGDLRQIRVVGTHSPPEAVSPGVHALSNHVLDTPWPKSTQAVQKLASGSAGLSIEELLELLDDRKPAPPEALPDTGVGFELESMLSAPFIVNETYGTRSSTGLLIGSRISVAERTFGTAGQVTGERRFSWSLPDGSR
jgi:uncharacterized protein with NRDE domain